MPGSLSGEAQLLRFVTKGDGQTPYGASLVRKIKEATQGGRVELLVLRGKTRRKRPTHYL
ncbi:hypothetical protein JCM16814_07330 [Desulfobaculum senezii]